MAAAAASTPTSTARCSAAARSLFRDAEGNFSLLAGARARGLPPRRRRGRDQVGPAQGPGRRGRAPDRAARLHLRDGLRPRRSTARRRFLTGDLAARATATVHEQIEDSGAPRAAARALRGPARVPRAWHLDREFSHLFRGHVDARRGERAASASTATATCAWSTTASSRRAETLEAERPRLPPDPARGVEGARGRGAHARARLRAARSASRSATRARTSASPRVVGRFFLVANGLERDDDPRGPRTERDGHRGPQRRGLLRGRRPDARRALADAGRLRAPPLRCRSRASSPCGPRGRSQSRPSCSRSPRRCPCRA